MISVTFTDSLDNVTSVKSLYQWDVGQTLEISGLNLSVAPKVHFATKVEDVAYVVQSELSNGKVQVNIPDKVLSHGYPVIAYVYYEVGLDKKTIKVATIPVIKRQKPADWIDTTPSQILQVKNYLDKIDADLKDLTGKFNYFAQRINGYDIPKMKEDANALKDRVDRLEFGFGNKTTQFKSDGTIVETYMDTTTTVTFNSDGSVTERIVKGDTTTIRTTYFDSDGKIREVIT